MVFSSARLTASVKLDNGGLVILVFLLVTNPSSPKRDFLLFWQHKIFIEN